jgi:hypothetical protein
MKRVDANHSEIVKGLRAVGATVRSTAMVGDGFPDVAVGYRGLTWLFEIKDGAKSKSRRTLTPAEQIFHNEWRGAAAVVTSLDDALKTIGATNSPVCPHTPKIPT